MKLSKTVLAILCLTGATISPLLANAGETPEHQEPVATANTAGLDNASSFGKRGQWFLMAPTLSVWRDSFDNASGFSGSHVGNYGLEMVLGTFIRDHLSLGVDLAASYLTAENGAAAPAQPQSYSSWSTSAQLRVGWQRALNGWFSLWPTVGLGGSYSHNETPFDDGSGTASTATSTTKGLLGTIELPLLLHVSRHFFVDVSWIARVSSSWTSSGNQLQGNTFTLIGLGGWI
jgi:opacity protein-like surface antigen